MTTLKRIQWKKGMRLTDDILRQSDECHAALAARAFQLSQAGRWGLFSDHRPFHVAFDIEKDLVTVVSLDCLALTKDGTLVDISYDTHYTGAMVRTAQFPSTDTDKVWLLTVGLKGQEWRDRKDGYCVPDYSFGLVEENTPVPDQALPIARIVYDRGWREDDLHFAPPCIYLSAHPKYQAFRRQFLERLVQLDQMVPSRLMTESRDAVKIFWPVVEQAAITMDKQADRMSPLDLLAELQKCVAAFYCACTLDEYLDLSEAAKFRDFVRAPYSGQDVYRKIGQGLDLCDEICRKIEAFVNPDPEPEPSEVPVPLIDGPQLHQFATSNHVRVKVTGIAPGATVFYALDESDPSRPLMRGTEVPLDPGFNTRREKEADKVFRIKLKAQLDGRSSAVGTYVVTVTKQVGIWTGKQI